jgi:hypothetical protein
LDVVARPELKAIRFRALDLSDTGDEALTGNASAVAAGRDLGLDGRPPPNTQIWP